MIEVALLLPWIALSFTSVMDFGFCAYGLIATQDAARIAATWGAANPTNAAAISSHACGYAAPSFAYAPTPVTACGTNLSVSTSASTVGSLSTVQVSVTYTMNLLAIPGLLPGSFAITRTVKMPVR